jgi:hypothetical protein
MPNANCRLHLTTRSRSAFAAIFILTLLILLGPTPFSVAQGWAKEITLEWDPNTEPDLGGYIVHYGTESGVYDYSLDVGNFTSAVISGLDPELEYYFAVSAYNIDGEGSGLSNEVTTDLAPSAQYQPSGGGGGGGCFIQAAEARFTPLNAFKTWWHGIEKTVVGFLSLISLSGEISQED